MHIEDDAVYISISDISKEHNLDKRRIYEWVRILENSNIIKFNKSPLGNRLVRTDQIDIILEYGRLEDVFDNPNDILHILESSTEHMRHKIVQEDFSWMRGLKNIVWRRF